MSLGFPNKGWRKGTRKAGRIICRPSFVTTICSFQFHVTRPGVESVHDAPLLSMKLLKVLFNHVRFLLYNNDIGIFYTVNEYK